LQTSDFIIKEIGSHIRYIDGAQTQKLPWSFVRPVEKYTKAFLSDIEIMLRPQWKYNYTLLTNNLYDFYSNILSGYEYFVPAKSLTDVLDKLNKFFYVISFPSIERKNILLHCLLGHEIGHLAAKEYFTPQREQEFLQSIPDKITPIADKRIEEECSNVLPLLIPQIRQQMTQTLIKQATDAWRKGLEELLSDIVGCFLFGPAILFSILEFAVQDFYGLDGKPDRDNNYYPPWRMRLRNILEVIKDLQLYPLPEDKFKSKSIIDTINKRFKLIENMTKEIPDKEIIATDPVLKISYEEIDKDIITAKEIYKTKLGKLLVNASNLYKYLPDLIERIDHGIPPNAYEKSINEREPAKIFEIINAVWFYKLSWEDCLLNKSGIFSEDIYEKRNRMNQLALKALEYSDIEKEYIDWYLQKTGHLPKYEAEG
jgi:hypothetical protein